MCRFSSGISEHPAVHHHISEGFQRAAEFGSVLFTTITSVPALSSLKLLTPQILLPSEGAVGKIDHVLTVPGIGELPWGPLRRCRDVNVGMAYTLKWG
jgi:hypothetical protein